MAITKEQVLQATGGSTDPQQIFLAMQANNWSPAVLASALKGTSESQISGWIEKNVTPQAAASVLNPVQQSGIINPAQPNQSTPTLGTNSTGGISDTYNNAGTTTGYSYTPKLDGNGMPDAGTVNYIKQIKERAANSPYPGMTAEQSVTKAIADYANQYNLDATQLASGFNNITSGMVSNYANAEGRTVPGVGVGGSDTAGGGVGGINPTQQNPDMTTYPKPPGDINFFGAADTQGNANYNAAVDTSRLSNPNIVNPFGGQKVGYDENGRPIVEQYLSNTEQNRLDEYKSLQPTLFGNIENSLSNPFNVNDAHNISTDITAGGVSGVADALWEREQPRMQQNRNQNETNLLVRGFNPGTEGYDDRMDEVSRAENDFRLGTMSVAGQEQSRLFGLEQAKHNQDLSDMTMQREQPLNEYNNVYGSFTPTMPDYQQFQGTNVEASPYYQSAVDQGLFGLQRYSTGIQGELGTRSIDANKKATNIGIASDLIGAGMSAYGA